MEIIKKESVTEKPGNADFHMYWSMVYEWGYQYVIHHVILTETGVVHT